MHMLDYDMQLMINLDTAYLVLQKERTRITGYFRLDNVPASQYKYKDNGAILIECHTLRDIVISAAEAETKGVFQNIKKSYSLYFNCHEISPTSNTNCNR